HRELPVLEPQARAASRGEAEQPVGPMVDTQNGLTVEIAHYGSWPGLRSPRSRSAGSGGTAFSAGGPGRKGLCARSCCRGGRSGRRRTSGAEVGGKPICARSKANRVRWQQESKENPKCAV